MRVLVDTGPLVAIISPDDPHHEICSALLKSMPSPLLTCWPVITEAAWLLRQYPFGFERLLKGIQEGFLEILPVAGSETVFIGRILKKYASLRPQFADAMLVYLAARENLTTVFTLDRRDFSVYRAAGGRPFRLLPELS